MGIRIDIALKIILQTTAMMLFSAQATTVMLSSAGIALRLLMRITNWLLALILPSTISATLAMDSMVKARLAVNLGFIAYHLLRIKYSAVNFRETISRTFILLKNILRTKRMYMAGKPLTQAQIADLRQRRNEIKDSVDHVCDIAIVGIISRNSLVCGTYMCWYILHLRLLREDEALNERNIDDCLRVRACMLIMEIWMLARIFLMVTTSVCTVRLIIGCDLTSSLPPPLIRI